MPTKYTLYVEDGILKGKAQPADRVEFFEKYGGIPYKDGIAEFAGKDIAGIKKLNELLEQMERYENSSFYRTEIDPAVREYMADIVWNVEKREEKKARVSTRSGKFFFAYNGRSCPGLFTRVTYEDLAHGYIKHGGNLGFRYIGKGLRMFTFDYSHDLNDLKKAISSFTAYPEIEIDEEVLKAIAELDERERKAEEERQRKEAEIRNAYLAKAEPLREIILDGITRRVKGCGDCENRKNPEGLDGIHYTCKATGDKLYAVNFWPCISDANGNSCAGIPSQEPYPCLSCPKYAKAKEALKRYEEGDENGSFMNERVKGDGAWDFEWEVKKMSEHIKETANLCQAATYIVSGKYYRDMMEGKDPFLTL